jgi:hypothetical protein
LAAQENALRTVHVHITIVLFDAIQLHITIFTILLITVELRLGFSLVSIDRFPIRIVLNVVMPVSIGNFWYLTKTTMLARLALMPRYVSHAVKVFYDVLLPTLSCFHNRKI